MASVSPTWSTGVPSYVYHSGRARGPAVSAVCTGETYKRAVKLTFAKGAWLNDPARLFNSSLDGAVRRAIDIPEGEKVDASAFKALVRQAVALNSSVKAQ